jgi:hypothetical protein
MMAMMLLVERKKDALYFEASAEEEMSREVVMEEIIKR